MQARQYPVNWDESHWDREQWRPHETFRPVLDLIDKVARDFGRTQFLNEPTPLLHDVRVPLVVDAAGRIAIGEMETSARRSVALTYTVHRIMRRLARGDAARLIRQVDIADASGTTRRQTVVRWDRQKLPTAIQIKKLHRAVLWGSPFRIEAAWFGLTSQAHDYLSDGYEIARRLERLQAYTGELEVSATIIPVAMLAPDLLKLILPYAVRAVSHPGRRPMHFRDEALAELFRIFIEVSGHNTTSARRGGYNEPVGPGAEFVRGVEAIFGVQLAPPSSTHAVARAIQRMTEQRA